MVAHIFNPSTQEADWWISEFEATWSKQQVPGQPVLHRETLSLKKQTNKQKKRLSFMAGEMAQQLRAVAAFAEGPG